MMVRYVDDSRIALPPIREGWKWVEGALKYTKKWELEDRMRGTTAEGRTKNVLKGTMNGIENYLEFTVESGEEFDGGWLPTLDTCLKVREDNIVEHKFYEKETSSSKTVQKRTAFEENSKIQVVSYDLVRRLN